jgi:hypothetical protein
MLLDPGTMSLIPTSPFKPYPRPAPKDAFEIAPTLNKGLGMFAKKNIAEGGMILVESPCVVCPVMGSETFPKYIFERLGPAQQKAVLSLANNKPPEVCDKYTGIIRTNGFQLNLPIEDGQPEVSSIHSGVFLNMSRCNHRCEKATKKLPFHIFCLVSLVLKLFFCSSKLPT